MVHPSRDVVDFSFIFNYIIIISHYLVVVVGFVGSLQAWFANTRNILYVNENAYTHNITVHRQSSRVPQYTRAMHPLITPTLITAYTANGVAVVLRHVRCRTIYRWMRNTKTFHLKKKDLFEYESSHFNQTNKI